MLPHAHAGLLCHSLNKDEATAVFVVGTSDDARMTDLSRFRMLPPATMDFDSEGEPSGIEP